MSSLLGTLFGLMFFFLGMVLVIGAHRRWDWLVNPPDDMWTCYSLAFIKKLFGKDSVVVFTYFLGILFMLLALFGLLNILMR
jgi:hypothetical protein